MEPEFALAAMITVLFAVVLYELFVRERLISLCINSNTLSVAGGYQRIALASLVFASCWSLMGAMFIGSIPASRFIQPYADWLVLALALTFGWLVWSRSKRAPAELLSCALHGTVVVGGLAFVLSALSGPLLFPTKINQGVLVGLFLIAPAFSILGGIGSMFAWSIRAKPEGSAASRNSWTSANAPV